MNVRQELARIRQMILTETKIALLMPFKVILKIPHCTSGSPEP